MKNTKKLYMTKGLPASGKSTWAKQHVDSNPDIFRVNKDDLRAMLHNSKYSKSNENFVLMVRDFIIEETLKGGNSIVVDDTNLHEKHEIRLRELAEKYQAVFDVVHFDDITLEECIRRDAARPNSVGAKVIKDMHKQYYGQYTPVKAPIFDPKLETAIICDLDGTFAILNGRNPYDASICEKDGINLAVYDILFNYQDKNIIFVSGREDKYKEQTKSWLKETEIKYADLIMRKSGDMRKDSIIKREIYEEHIKGKYNVLFVLDDRNQVVDMWRELGLTCLQVAEGDF